MRAKLEFALSGPPRVTLVGQPVTGFKTVKAQALLYYLVVTGQHLARTTLANLLWGDMPEEQARVNLSKALSELRALFLGHIIIERQQVAFDCQSDYWLDLQELRSASDALSEEDRSPAHHERLSKNLAQAADLYRGDFLEGFYVRNAPEFEMWMLAERRRQQEFVVEMLHKLVEKSIALKNWRAGIDYARRLLAIEPWREAAHRQLMLLLASSGQRTTALAQFEICRQILAAELDVEPDALTIALCARVRAWDFDVRADISDQQTSGENGVGHAPADTSPPLPASPLLNLPYYPTPFVGRENEIADILSRMQDPDCRLLTLAGPGGIGKTRLAIEAVRRLLNSLSTREGFTHGCFFVSLQPVNGLSDMVSAIAVAAHFQFYGDMPPKEQLLAYLRQKRMLLILDNFEHLLSHADLVMEILATAPDMKLLVTSREALKLRQEWFHPISGMRYSQEPSGGPEAVADYDAVRLFVQSARRVRADFSFSAEQEQVLRICRLVDGRPLAVELAAAWRKTLPSTVIADEIEDSLDILTALDQDIPQRHRSMRVLLEQSWRLLSDVEQEGLRCLSLCQGGFRPDAAAEIAGSSLLTLASLVEKSLLQAGQNGRFQMHELLRQFAEEKLDELPELVAMTRRRHVSFYLRFVQQRTERLLGREQGEALIEIDHEIDNVRAAWNRAIVREAADEIGGGMNGLYHYYLMRSRFQEGQESFALAISQFSARTKSANATLLTRLAARQVDLCIKLGRYVEAEALLDSACTEVSDKHEEVFVLYLRGVIADRLHKDRTRAERWLRQSLELSQQIGDLAGQIMALRQLAAVCDSHGMPTKAEEMLADALSISRRLSQPSLVADVLIDLGWLSSNLGRYARAQACGEESHVIYKKLGNDHGVGVALQWLGWAQWCAGDSHLAAAIGLYEQALSIYTRNGAQFNMAVTLGDMSLALTELGDPHRALQCAQEGLRLMEAIGDVHQMLYALMTVGAAACALADYANARSYLTRALALAQQHHVLSNSAYILYVFANVVVAESEATPDVHQQNEQKRQALQLYSVVINDSAAWQVIRDRAGARLEQLAIDMPPMTMTEGHSDAKTVEEWAIRILDEASSSRNPHTISSSS